MKIPGISGMAILKSGRLLATDMINRNLLLFELTNNSLLFSLSMPRYPWGIAVLDNHVVAVTCPPLGIMVVLSTIGDKLFKDKEIEIGYCCRGIVRLKDQLVVSYGHPNSGVKLLDIDGTVLKEFINPNHDNGSPVLQEPWYMTLDETSGSIIVSEAVKPVLVIYDICGEVKEIFRLKSPSNIKSPRGLTKGPEGYCFLSGFVASVVSLVSIKTKDVYNLLCETDGICCPASTIYDDKTQTFYVGQHLLEGEDRGVIKAFSLKR